MQTIVTKAEYAALKQRTAGSISHWITEGKITEAALIGKGHRARIWVEQADIDLARALDPAQQLAQPHPILPPATPAALSLVGEDPATRSSPNATAAAEIDADIASKRKADARRAEADAIAAERRNAVEDGRYIDAVEAMRAWTTELSRHITDTETFLTNTLARLLADQYGIDWKQLSAKIRTEYRRHRGEIADGAKGEMAAAAE